MILWLTFIIISLLLSLLYDLVKNNKIKYMILFTIILLLTYFSGFRDGLGVDYAGYVNMLKRYVQISDNIVISEPLYNYFSYLVVTSSFSYILFFVSMSFITILYTFLVYGKFNNLFLFSYIYILFPALYISSFNLVRSAAVGALFLFASKYIKEKNAFSFFKYTCIIIAAALIHKSAFLLIPLYFISTKNYLKWAISLVIGMMVIVLLFDRLIGYFEGYLYIFGYINYLYYDQWSANLFGFTNIVLLTIAILLIVKQNDIVKLKNSEFYVISVKMYFLSLFFYILSALVFPITYRFFFMLIPFLPIAIHGLAKVIDYKLIYIFVYGAIGLIAIVHFVNGINNPLIIPDKILPLHSIIE